MFCCSHCSVVNLVIMAPDCTFWLCVFILFVVFDVAVTLSVISMKLVNFSGNCDVKYENTDAGRESLADHHQEKLLSLDDTHTELFRHPGWGEEPCVCILCDCEVGSPVEFLQHLKSNLEEEVPENRTKHKDILKSIIEDLIGMEIKNPSWIPMAYVEHECLDSEDSLHACQSWHLAWVFTV